MKKYLKLIRVKHWIKNLLIFIPLISARLFYYDSIGLTIFGFLAFSFATSFVYILNDIKDIEKDKLHEKKKNRPLASGEISKTRAMVVAVLMIILSIIINTIINNSILNTSLFILLAYIIINILYSCGLKNVVIVDIVLLASGFVLRVFYGAALLHIYVSDWLFLTILNGALFLGLGKRKKELVSNISSRKVLLDYSENFLDKMQYVVLTLMFVFYSLWSMEQNVKYLIYTIPFVMIIFMRYCLIIEKNDEGDPTSILYKDIPLLILALLYGIIMLIIFMM